MIHILFIGDIVGRPGRRAVTELLPKLREEYAVDFVVANGENLTSGKGFNEPTIRAMREAGVDFFTMGNHVFANRDGYPLLDDPSMPIIRPANLGVRAPGRGYQVVTVGTKRLLILSLIAPRIMTSYTDSPFQVADEILAATHGQYDHVLLDFHAEFTSEKAILAWYLDGRVDAVVGTHTHIPTADARILPKGTATITDVGMVGLKWSSLGVDVEPLVRQAITGLPERHEISNGPVVFSAVLLSLQEGGHQIEHIQREVGEG